MDIQMLLMEIYLWQNVLLYVLPSNQISNTEHKQEAVICTIWALNAWHQSEYSTSLNATKILRIQLNDAFWTPWCQILLGIHLTKDESQQTCTFVFTLKCIYLRFNNMFTVVFIYWFSINMLKHWYAIYLISIVMSYYTWQPPRNR